jgi:hypothetical protein
MQKGEAVRRHLRRTLSDSHILCTTASRLTTSNANIVVPAQAGIPLAASLLNRPKPDAGFRRHDGAEGTDELLKDV